jgi:hypothetical protein
MHLGIVSVNSPLNAKLMAARLHALSRVPMPALSIGIVSISAFILICCSVVMVFISWSLFVLG